MPSAAAPPSRSYMLGHSADELNRLIDQSRFFGDLTHSVLQAAGVDKGMRVLDIGCGVGDVSFLAARLVGPDGEVIGVDTSPEAIAVATRRADAAGLANVRFVIRDAADLTLDEPVDALVGRLVLMYFADPAVMLRRLLGVVKPGGIVAFQEIDMETATSAPRCPVFETAVERIKEAFTRGGCDIRTGLKLARIFQEAGLPAPCMNLGARIESGPDAAIYEQPALVTRSLLPIMERTALASAAEVDVDTLAARIREEAVALEATLVSPALIGAWTHNTQAKG
ncbi:MAG: methylase involved in ubiquinone/menaquinone biosynthesis [Thermomicrobiales bacterium]|nr:methylase involved in ubiquinone/menaquinone biosynthesis [Thermomicrobiales bacterium]